MFTILLFFIVLSVLVLVHEFGHFYFAKKAGMRVDEFGFGFPPRIWGIRKGETIYSVNVIPFGGFVKVHGENGEDKDDPRSFARKPLGARARLLVAGVLMNFLLAVVLLIVGSWLGLRIAVAENVSPKGAKQVFVQIVQVAPGSPAAEQDLRPLDEIVAMQFAEEDIRPISVSEVQQFINAHSGQEIILSLRRGKQEFQKILVPRQNPPAGQGAVGIVLTKTALVSYPWYEAILRGIQSAFFMTINIAMALGIFFKDILLSGRVGADITGPVGIATLTAQASRVSFSYLLQFVAILSLNLAILNIIPFPALDGGRLLLLGVERIRRRPMDKRTEGFINAAGFAFLLGLMVLITIRDVGKLF